MQTIIFYPEKEKEATENIPVTTVGWLFTEMWFFSEPWVDPCFSGRSAKTAASEGTRVARSGGWSFPTVGLACQKQQQKFNLTKIERK